MMATRRYLPLLAGLAVALLALVAGGGAGKAGEGVRSTIAPVPAKGRGDKCVADTSFMRRYHMSVLSHQRDDTVHDGIRTKQFSLKECIDCHQVKGADGRAVTVEDPKHFCRTCHDYAAVSVDCFECHASRPGEPTKTGRAPPARGSSEAAALAHYLSRSQSR
ncbi:MAG: cytochrome c3 family protein [Pseudomonadota bacterium]